jgi:hypothetical protein
MNLYDRRQLKRMVKNARRARERREQAAAAERLLQALERLHFIHQPIMNPPEPPKRRWFRRGA